MPLRVYNVISGVYKRLPAREVFCLSLPNKGHGKQMVSTIGIPSIWPFPHFPQDSPTRKQIVVCFSPLGLADLLLWATIDLFRLTSLVAQWLALVRQTDVDISIFCSSLASQFYPYSLSLWACDNGDLSDDLAPVARKTCRTILLRVYNQTLLPACSCQHLLEK